MKKKFSFNPLTHELLLTPLVIKTRRICLRDRCINNVIISNYYYLLLILYFPCIPLSIEPCVGSLLQKSLILFQWKALTDLLQIRNELIPDLQPAGGIVTNLRDFVTSQRADGLWKSEKKNPEKVKKGNQSGFTILQRYLFGLTYSSHQRLFYLEKTMTCCMRPLL